jgi:hypothetical protein
MECVSRQALKLSRIRFCMLGHLHTGSREVGRSMHDRCDTVRTTPDTEILALHQPYKPACHPAEMLELGKQSSSPWT